MKNELSCEIVRDLLPLYIDGVVSETTREAVDQHLQSCASCRKEAEKMKPTMPLPINENVQRSQATILKRIRQRFFRKKVIVSLLSILAAVAVLSAGYAFMALHQTVIPYDGEHVTVRELDGELFASCDLTEQAGSVACISSPVTIDGERENVVVVYFYQTPWSTYIEPYLPFHEDATEITFSLGSVDGLGEGDGPIDKVFYGDYDYQELLMEDWQTAADGSIGGMALVWENDSE